MLTLRRQSLWMTEPEKQIRCLPKGAGKERIRAEMQQLIEDERLNEHEHIYTDGSLKEEQVGCAVVMPSYTLKYRLLPQTTIFNAEIFAISKAMEQPNEKNCSRIIMTDSLCSMTALEKVFPSKNSMENKILNMLAEKGKSLKLMWVPAHTGKDALNEDILPGTKATEIDWKRLLKNAARRIFENKWMTSENAMLQIKPNMKKYNCT
jgi:ribonuclease HI